MKLEISLFRFDYKSDYLPYYTKHFIKVEEEKILLDILNTLNKNEPFSYEAKEEANIVVNGQFLDCSISCQELVENFGKDLIIEPISIRRSCNDFIINEDDFTSKLELFEELLSNEDREKYASYKKYFYASHTLAFEKEYIGDAALLLADDLIQKDGSNKKAVLKILKDHETGAQFHTSLENRVYNLDSEITKKIENIRELLTLVKDADSQNLAKTKINFPKEKESCEIKHDFKDFNIAYYAQQPCEDTLKFIDSLAAYKVTQKHGNDDLAKKTFHINSEFTFKLASKVILEAFDQSADFLVVDNANDFYIFDNYQDEMSKVSGREVKLPVLHFSELQLLACGDHEEAKKLLASHKNNPELI